MVTTRSQFNKVSKYTTRKEVRIFKNDYEKLLKARIPTMDLLTPININDFINYF